ncbi:methyltransferase domain-containing protein [Rhizorhabdus dicambivorans]|uniref:Methyltransferase type 11 n=1 Tax=Rhizorhabdus dicambivorans TaxID=1850238 RepID=A0A2A4G0Y2_9SPHN|nr:methyltransferase domain-containing protein [Rhizorhabdus dicambivorans]ATE63423.1 methyltransferase type 11 [Rhizorhabdus dicambivorans]PCE43641.1 methyltransferase type 11 [Rhizorhabdus dicambivorans]
MTATPPSRRIRIAAAFDRAEGYAAAADAQARAATMLAQRIAAASLPARPRILELGCGTGFLTHALAASIGAADWTVSDIAPAMVRRARTGLAIDADWRVIDGEALDPALGEFDLIASSMAFQWFADLPGAVERLARRLRAGGLLAFATMAAGSFAEWEDALRQEGLPSGTPAYPDADALARLAPPGFSADVAIADIVQEESDGRGFLRRLKAIGAGTPAPGYRPLAPAALRRAMARFDAGPRRVTYRIGFCLISPQN